MRKTRTGPVSLIDFGTAPPIGTKYYRTGHGYVAKATLCRVSVPPVPYPGAQVRLVWAAICSHCDAPFRTWSRLRQAQPLPAHCPKCRAEALRRAKRRGIAR